jgi:hypothetical protein
MARTVPVTEANGSVTVQEVAATRSVQITANDGVGSRTITVPVANLAGPNGLIQQLQSAHSSLAK